MKEIPNVIHRSLSVGKWNLLLISDKLMGFSVLEGVRTCIYHGPKSGTYLSKVTSIDWDHSMEKVYNVSSPPKQKSTLYEEIPSIPWNEHEWILYHKFKYNTRVSPLPILRECSIQFEHYQKWVTALPQFARIQPAFHPHCLDEYFICDFLFESLYHKELAHILGMLPSTSTFFSVGEYLLARILYLNNQQEHELFSLISYLGENNYYTTFHAARVVSTS